MYVVQLDRMICNTHGCCGNSTAATMLAADNLVDFDVVQMFSL